MLYSRRNRLVLNNLHNWPHKFFAGREEKKD